MSQIEKSHANLVVSHAPTITPQPVQLSPQTNPIKTSSLLAATDTLALFIASLIALTIRSTLPGVVYFTDYIPLLPIMILCVPCFAIARLYPNIPLAPATELRSTTIIISFVTICIAASTFLLQESPVYSRALLICAWLLSIIFVPLFRSFTRTLFANKPWFGQSVVIIGSGTAARSLLRSLINRPEIGLKPIALIRSPYSFSARSSIQNIPIIQDINSICHDPTHPLQTHAIIATPDFDSDQYDQILQQSSQTFKSTTLLSTFANYSALAMTCTDIDGQISFKLTPPSPQPLMLSLKRFFELLIVLALFPIAIPLISLICILIKLDSKGSPFYFQKRVGLNGRIFHMIKFRTMKTNADQLLHHYLTQNPNQRIEWKRTHKLKNDPRITRVGRILRKTSLDELPQIFNVMFGDMALVGPRPIFAKDIIYYGKRFDAYKRVRPGITGMWQTHGRNTLTHSERVQLDTYYVQHWSVWLDLYLMIKTISTVLIGRGAY